MVDRDTAWYARRRSILLVALVAVLAGALVAGIGARTRADAAPASGITGRAVSSLCGVAAAAGQACPDRPVRATIQVVRLSTKRRVAAVRTDAAGRFRVTLTPGAYELRPSASGSLLRARSIDVNVRSDRFARVTVTFYSAHPVPVASLPAEANLEGLRFALQTT